VEADVKHRDVVGWVLYDGSCGFCSHWVPSWGGFLRRHGFDFAALQEPWVRERLKPAAPEELLSDVRLLFADGRQLRGADVYRFFLRKTWFTYPLYLLAIAPLLRRVFDWGYRTFARNRFRVSSACQLPPRSA
jgi:predicted DCC family thiol-disulfide oxidoreductase YuxK